MNSNQPKNLTQKQKELVKRLDSIRNNKDLNKPEERTVSRNSQKRNENPKRNRPVSKKTRKPADRKRTRPSSQKEFARPVQSKQNLRNLNKETRKTTKKKQEHFIDQLSDGKNLSNAIILSEILSKPLALRKNK